GAAIRHARGASLVAVEAIRARVVRAAEAGLFADAVGAVAAGGAVIVGRAGVVRVVRAPGAGPLAVVALTGVVPVVRAVGPAVTVVAVVTTEVQLAAGHRHDRREGEQGEEVLHGSGFLWRASGTWC